MLEVGTCFTDVKFRFSYPFSTYHRSQCYGQRLNCSRYVTAAAKAPPILETWFFAQDALYVVQIRDSHLRIYEARIARLTQPLTYTEDQNVDGEGEQLQLSTDRHRDRIKEGEYSLANSELAMSTATSMVEYIRSSSSN